MNIIPPNPRQRFVNVAGLMSQVFRTWTQDVSREAVLIGTGTPEGVVDALQGRRYMDDAGTTGNIVYIKRDADIAGDTTKGWILV